MALKGELKCKSFTLKGKLNTGIREVPIDGGFDYTNALNKPSINDIELTPGNHTLDELNIQPKGDYINKTAFDEKIKELEDKGIKCYVLEDTYTFPAYTTSTSRAIDKKEFEKLKSYVDDVNNGKPAVIVVKCDYNNSSLSTILFLSPVKSPIQERRYSDEKNVGAIGSLASAGNYLTNNIGIDIWLRDDGSGDVNSSQVTYRSFSIPSKEVENLTNYYKKTQTYNQEEIDQKIGAIKTNSFKSVDQLPDMGEENVIYLVPSSKSFANNVKDEFIWLTDDQKFEQIGSTQIDLSDYYNSTQVDEKVDEETSDLLKTLSRELKTPDETGFSAQTVVNIKNKSGATETIMEIDNLDITTDVPTNSVLGTLKGQDLEERVTDVENLSNIIFITNITSDTANDENLKKQLSKLVSKNIGKQIMIIYSNGAKNSLPGGTGIYTSNLIDKSHNYLGFGALLKSLTTGHYIITEISGEWQEDYFNVTTITTANSTQSCLLTADNKTEFEPKDDYNPATKKYVDDSVKGAIPVIEMESTMTQEEKTSHTYPILKLSEEQINTIVNNNVSILKVKFNVTVDDGTEVDTLVFYITIDNVEINKASNVVKTIKINAVRTNDEAEIIYHGELLGNGEQFATTIDLTPKYIAHE